MHWADKCLIRTLRRPTPFSGRSIRFWCPCTSAGGTAEARSASIVDVGGGESTPVNDLLEHGYQNITVPDISETAIDVTNNRLGASSKQAPWLVADITKVQLEPNTYDVWHDRALFHFLTMPEQRAAYVCQVAAAVRPGGHVIVSTFGPEGLPSAAVSMSWATTKNRCTTVRRALPPESEFEGTASNSVRAPHSSFSIAIAASNEWCS